jgi:hypothetical protein
VNSNVHVPGLEDQVEKLLLHNHFSRACVAFDQQKQEITFCADKKKIGFFTHVREDVKTFLQRWVVFRNTI